MGLKPYEYCKIGTTSEGYAVVEVSYCSVRDAIEAYDQTVKGLRQKSYPVANAQNRIEVSNHNSGRIIMVTVKGDEDNKPTETFLREVEKAEGHREDE
jgi:hypothetical protein